MTLVRRVQKNYLQTFKEIYRRGKRLNIHKITFLCQTHEKNCWRKVRVREEKVYYKKYNFLKHAYDVVNYGIEKNLKIQTEEEHIDEEDSYIDIDEYANQESQQKIRNEIYKIDVELKKIPIFFKKINQKYNDNSNLHNLIKQYYLNVITKNYFLNKSDFLKKFHNLNLCNSTDLMLIYFYLQKGKLLTIKKNYLNAKLHILKSRKNISDKVNYSYPVEKLSAFFDIHNKNIGVI